MAYYSNPNYNSGHRHSVSSGHHHHSHSHSPAPPGYSGGGYGYQQPPLGADPQLWQWFSAVDADRSGAISANELQSALVNGTSIYPPRFALDLM